MSFDYDVTIIGAGPIGSTLAYELIREGIKVCLIDKKKIKGYWSLIRFLMNSF